VLLVEGLDRPAVGVRQGRRDERCDACRAKRHNSDHGLGDTVASGR